MNVNLIPTSHSIIKEFSCVLMIDLGPLSYRGGTESQQMGNIKMK